MGISWKLQGRVERTSIESKLLEGNVLGDPHVRDVYAYLPPSYDGKKRFPTVMILPGFGGTNRSVLHFDAFRPNPVERLDRRMAEGACPEAIMVLPDAINRWGGSQYIDSATGGPYQSYLVDEILPHVDATYRTLPEKAGRVVVGRSSGGFGALRLGMDRPEAFAAVGSHAGDAVFEVSMRPSLLHAAIAIERAGSLTQFAKDIAERGPRDALEFDGVLILAASIAYSPDPGGPAPHALLPFDPHTGTLDGEIWSRWLSHDPFNRVASHADALRTLSLLYLDAGNQDEHGLHFAGRMLHEAFLAVGATVKYEEFEGGHRGTSHRYETSIPTLLGAIGQ